MPLSRRKFLQVSAAAAGGVLLVGGCRGNPDKPTGTPSPTNTPRSTPTEQIPPTPFQSLEHLQEFKENKQLIGGIEDIDFSIKENALKVILERLDDLHKKNPKRVVQISVTAIGEDSRTDAFILLDPSGKLYMWQADQSTVEYKSLQDLKNAFNSVLPEANYKYIEHLDVRAELYMYINSAKLQSVISSDPQLAKAFENVNGYLNGTLQVFIDGNDHETRVWYQKDRGTLYGGLGSPDISISLPKKQGSEVSSISVFQDERKGIKTPYFVEVVLTKEQMDKLVNALVAIEG